MLKTSNGFDLVTARDTEKSNRKKGETMLHSLDDGLPSHIMWDPNQKGGGYHPD